MTEHDLQCAVIEWCRVMRHTYPELDLLFAIPNGGHRHKATAAKLKAEGVKPGVPDLFLPLPGRRRSHGLFLELKTPKGKISFPQADWLEKLSRNGYMTVIGTELDAITDGVERYVLESRGWRNKQDELAS